MFKFKVIFFCWGWINKVVFDVDFWKVTLFWLMGNFLNIGNGWIFDDMWLRCIYLFDMFFIFNVNLVFGVS